MSVADEPSWQKLKDDGTYKIYDDPSSWGWPRYTVAAPGGGVVTCTYTKWGARRAIRKHRGQDDRPFWEKPIVAEVPK